MSVADEREAAREAAFAAWLQRDPDNQPDPLQRILMDAVYGAGFDAGAAWRREQDSQAYGDLLRERNVLLAEVIRQRDLERNARARQAKRIAKLESDLRIERGRVEALLNHAALAGEQ